MKRSRRVVLTLMGSAAVGAVSMGLVPRQDCGPGNTAVPGPDGRPYCRADLWRLRRRAAPASTATAMATAVTAWRRLTAPMQRIVCPERDDWRATAESAGFDFHTIDGERYWDERAYYAFTLDEIERQIEAPTGEIDAMCLELVGHAIDDEKLSAPAEDTGSVLAADFGELAPRRWQPLRPARSQLRRPRPGKTAGIQRGHPDLDLRGGGVPVDLARTGDRAQHHPEARRPVQFDP